MDLLSLLEGVAVAGFSLSGALAAVGRKLNVAVCCVVALAVGLAGGSLRDVLIGSPVFWLDHPAYLAVSLVAAGLAWSAGERSWLRAALVWSDAVGLAALCAVGAARAAISGVTPLAAAAVGVFAVAAAAGLRDVTAGGAALVAGRALHLAAAAGGGLTFVALRLLGLDDGPAAMGGALAALVLRAGAIRFGWSLPEAGEE